MCAYRASLVAPQSFGSMPQARNAPPVRPTANDEDDFADTDVGSLLG